MSADVTEHIRMFFTLPIHFHTYRPKTDYQRLPTTPFCKNKAHKRLDNCDILEKHAEIEIDYILKTRANPGK